MSHHTRQRLIDAARTLFWQKGYHGSSVAEILERAEANSGSLYHFFPTKQALLVAVLEWYRDNLGREIVEPARESTEDPVGRVLAVLEGYRQALLATDLTFGCPIGNLALEFKEPDPEVRELLALNFDGWRDAIAAFLEEAGDRFAADVDRRELATFVLTTMEGAVMQARTYRSIEPYDASVRQLERYLRELETASGGSSGANRTEKEAAC